MDIKERMHLVARDTQEIIQKDELKELLEKKGPTGYIGYAPTGRIHIGYFMTWVKVADFVKAGFDFTILLADVHAYLDDRKTPWSLLDARSEYYEEAIRSGLKAVGVDTSKVRFVRGSDFQMGKDYVMRLYKMLGEVTFNRAKRAAAEVVRFSEEPEIGSFVYPLMQINDVVGLKADLAFGGNDQRGIYMLGRELLPKMGEKTFVCVLAPLIPGLKGGKMSASVAESKVDLLEDPKEVVRKINDAYCPAGKAEDNGVLAFIRHVVMHIKADRKEPFVIERPAKYGGPASFEDYEALERLYVEGKVHPADLKAALAKEINALLQPIRNDFRGKERLIERAYPSKA